MDEVAIEIDSIEPISFADITPELARESGFEGVWAFTTCRPAADARQAQEPSHPIR